MRNTLKVLLAAAALGVSASASAQSVNFVFNDNTTQKFSTDRVKSISVVTSGDEMPMVQATDLTIEVYGRNAVLHFANADKTARIDLDLYGPEGASYLMTGTYAVKDGSEAFTIGTDIKYTSFTIDGATLGITGGTLNVSAEGPVYTITGAFTLSDGSEQGFTFTGQLPAYSPYRSFTLSGASYNENPRDPGQFYVKFHDSAYNIEMALILVCEPGAAVLAPGRYVRGTEATPGTYISGSYIDLYNPNFSDREFTGSCTVANEGANYTFIMDFTLSNGQCVSCTYEGEISGTPAFTSPAADAALRKGPAFMPTR